MGDDNCDSDDYDDADDDRDDRYDDDKNTDDDDGDNDVLTHGGLAPIPTPVTSYCTSFLTSSSPRQKETHSDDLMI